MDWQPTTDTAYNFHRVKRTSSNGTEPRSDPDPSDELLNLAVLFGGLAFWLWMAWLWGWA